MADTERTPKQEQRRMAEKAKKATNARRSKEKKSKNQEKVQMPTQDAKRQSFNLKEFLTGKRCLVVTYAVDKRDKEACLSKWAFELSESWFDWRPQEEDPFWAKEIAFYIENPGQDSERRHVYIRNGGRWRAVFWMGKWYVYDAYQKDLQAHIKDVLLAENSDKVPDLFPIVWGEFPECMKHRSADDYLKTVR